MPADRVGDRERELLGEMVGKRGLGRDERFEIVVAVVAPAGTDAGPFRNRAAGSVLCGASSGPLASSGNTFSRLVSRRSSIGGAAGLEVLAEPGLGSHPVIHLGRALGGGFGRGTRLAGILPSLARSSSGLRSSSPST